MPSKAEIEKTIANFGDRKSNGAWAANVARHDAAEKKHIEKLEKFGSENSQHPIKKPKPRQENVIERIDRINYEFGNSKKRPKHLDNKSIYSFEDQEIFKNNINREPKYPTKASPRQMGQLVEKLEKQRQMTGEMSTWDIMKATAKTPAEKKEIRDVIRDDYNKHGAKNIAEADLKWIGKAKSQQPIMDFKIDASGISDSINNYINATRVNAPVAPPPKKPKDPDLNLGVASLLGVFNDS